MECSRCEERPAYCKGMCPRCYYATKRGVQTRLESRRIRNYVVGDAGYLTGANGEVWIVDVADFPLVSGRLWNNNGNGYARSWKTYLHRLLLPDAAEVDHIDRDRSNNRRQNLRPATRGVNVLNARISPRNTSGYRGVRFEKGVWVASVQKDKTRFRLGQFPSKKDAARAVRTWAVENGRAEFYPEVF